ncbi:MAG: RNA 2',3'-cyclic phosphodiesterase [Opitutales bacterium]
MRRLFIAIDIPENIRTILQELIEEIPGVSWKRPDQYHITLKFLGDADEDRVVEVLKQISVRAFFLPIQGLGVFPKVDAPRVLWAGVGQGHPHLFQLYKKIQDSLYASGIQPDLRPYSPHITLARCSSQAHESIRQLLKSFNDWHKLSIYISEFQLYESIARPTGNNYEPIQSFKLDSSIGNFL